MKINIAGILNVLSVLLFLNAGFMATCVPAAIYYEEPTLHAWAWAIGFSLLAGAVLYLGTFKMPGVKDVKKRDGYIIVTLSWFTMAFSGVLPYMFTGAIPQFTDAFFESISGFTTTGATILDNIEEMPKSILLWRSLTQWLGGLGFIVLVVSILPSLGIGGLQLFMAETPGITAEKLKPRIQDTAKRLWILYAALTLAEVVMLHFAGMSVFDAINHSFTTLSTGGFSTKQDSIAFFDSRAVDYIIILFMTIGGTGFVLSYNFLKGKFSILLKNEEFRAFIAILAAASFVVAMILIFQEHYELEKAFRTAAFQVIAICTGTGYATADFTLWGGGAIIIFFTLMFIGGSAGSTTGSVKVIRHLIIAKNSVIEFRRQLHLSAIIPVRINGKPVPHEVTRNILAFVIIYLTIFGVGSVIMSLAGVDALTSMGSVASALGNVGPGLSGTGPSETYAALPVFSKWMLGILMVVGRLEIFTVLIIFTPYFWRST